VLPINISIDSDHAVELGQANAMADGSSCASASSKEILNGLAGDEESSAQAYGGQLVACDELVRVGA
jgi:hypothetical protein